MTTILETSRLRLRKMVESDYDSLFALFSDKQVMEFYPPLSSAGEVSLWTQAWLQRTLERYETDGTAMWIAENKDDGSFVGQIGLTKQTFEENTELEVGYLLRRACWGKGLATEAARACREYAFDKLGRDRVVSLIRPENLRSAAVARRVGMEPERNLFTFGFLHRLWVSRRQVVA